MAEQIDKIKELIEQSKSFALILDKNPEEYELLSREALKSALCLKGVFVYLLPKNDENFIEKWSAAISKFENTPPSYFVSLNIPKKKFKIKEIFYESNDEFFTLNIGTEGGGLTPENIIFKPKATAIDAVFCFGSPEIKWSEITKDEMSLPGKEKIVFITNKDKTIAEKIKDIISIIDEKLLSESNISTLLFAALILETDNFTRNISEKNISLAGVFLKSGAAKKVINEILEKEKTDSFAQLLGRAMARTRIHEKLLSSWTFLSKEDLEKTGYKNDNPRLFYKILLKMCSSLPTQQLSLIFWQEEDGVHLLASTFQESKENLISLSEKLNGDFNGKFLIAGPFKNFSEAEIQTREALKEIIK